MLLVTQRVEKRVKDRESTVDIPLYDIVVLIQKQIVGPIFGIFLKKPAICLNNLGLSLRSHVYVLWFSFHECFKIDAYSISNSISLFTLNHLKQRVEISAQILFQVETPIFTLIRELFTRRIWIGVPICGWNGKACTFFWYRAILVSTQWLHMHPEPQNPQSLKIIQPPHLHHHLLQGPQCLPLYHLTWPWLSLSKEFSPLYLNYLTETPIRSQLKILRR